MPYKDKAKQLAAQRRCYQGRKQKCFQENQARRVRNKKFLMDFKVAVGCSLCEETHPACLDFHHIDRTLKGKTLSLAANNSWSIEHLEAEIKKCIVLCSNCHRKLHWEQNQPS